VMGGTVATVTPRTKIEATRAMLEVYAKTMNINVIRSECTTAKSLRLPVLSDSQPKTGMQNIAAHISKLAKKTGAKWSKPEVPPYKFQTC
jgi:hypothetical protein